MKSYLGRINILFKTIKQPTSSSGRGGQTYSEEAEVTDLVEEYLRKKN